MVSSWPSIGEVNEALGTDFETVGGLVLGHLGRVPQTGDEIHLDGYLLRVAETDGPRIAQIVIREAEERKEDGRK
jgi:Mg2+/Co2+ transporter CorC